MLGLVVGSFLATVLIRWPAGRSVIGGRSRCDGCGAALGPLELVPLALLAGPARALPAVRRGDRPAGMSRSSSPPALIGVVAALAHPLPLALVTAGFGWWLLLIAALDLEHQWLPDLLTLPLLALGLAAAWAGFGPPLAERAIGAAIGWAALALIAFLYRRLARARGDGRRRPQDVRRDRRLGRRLEPAGDPARRRPARPRGGAGDAAARARR